MGKLMITLLAPCKTPVKELGQNILVVLQFWAGLCGYTNHNLASVLTEGSSDCRSDYVSAVCD
jgi:hypothetical protein